MEYKLNRHQLETETALRVSEEKFRVLFESAIDGIFLLSDNGDVADLNTSFAKMHGYTVGEMMKMNLKDLDTPESAKLAPARLQQLFAGEPLTFEVEHYCKNGQMIPLEVSANLVTIGNEKYILGFHRDITERKHIEGALRESENLLRESQVIAGLGSYVLDISTGWWKSSDVLDKLFGIDEAYEHSVEGWEALLHPDDRKMMTDYFTNEVVGKGRAFDKEYRIIRHNDRVERWVYGLGKLEFDIHGSPVKMHGTIRDITGNKKAEEERERLNRELEIKNKELEQIIYAASHDLKSPLVNINGYGSELKNTINDIARAAESEDISSENKKEILSLIKELPESFRFISTSIARMDTLLNGLLEFSRSGNLELKEENIDMNILIKEIADNLNYKLKDAGASLEITDLPRCTGDMEQISRVFSNLMENAIKYLDPLRKGEIKVTGYVKDNSSFYCVEDNGIGIAVDHQKQIFHIFHQLDPAKAGEGLGLAIVQRIVERHGGKIWLESEAGKGCRFFVGLPI